MVLHHLLARSGLGEEIAKTPPAWRREGWSEEGPQSAPLLEVPPPPLEKEEPPPGLSITSERIEKRRGVLAGTGLFLVFLLIFGFKLFKSGKVILGTLAAGSFVSWLGLEVGLLFTLLLLIHEVGHVFAMYRSGFEVRGIYLIPFVGGLAVGEKRSSLDRRTEAYIALAGPMASLIPVLCLLLIFLQTVGEYPILGAAAGLGALLNLVNLLPVLPLDGGKIFRSVVVSIHRAGGLLLVGLLCCTGIVLAFHWGLTLLLVVLVLGLFEFGVEVQKWKTRACLSGTRVKREELPWLAWVDVLASQAFLRGKEEMEKAHRERLDAYTEADTHSEASMGAWQCASYALSSVLLGLIYLGVLVVLEDHGSGLGFLLGVLR